MRLSLIAASLIAGSLLVACQVAARGGAPVASDAISVTPLDAPATAEPFPDQPAATDADPTTKRPKPRPDFEAQLALSAEPVTSEPVTAEPDAAAAPEAPRSPEQLLCEKTGGQWAVAGATGAYICVKPTRDGGKQCRKKADCEGLCLARSGSCAPFTPLFGCNEVLEKDGRRMTLCIG